MKKCHVSGEKMGRKRLNGKTIYNRRVDTRSSWESLGKKYNCTAKSCLRAARRYAIENNKDWPIFRLTVAEMAYNDRVQGYSWVEIAKGLNMQSDSARRAAYRYAALNDLNWPPGEHGKPIPKEKPEPLYSQSLAVYQYRLATQKTWREISLHFGFNHSYGYIMAKRYARENNLPWPI